MFETVKINRLIKKMKEYHNRQDRKSCIETAMKLNSQYGYDVITTLSDNIFQNVKEAKRYYLEYQKDYFGDSWGIANTSLDYYEEYNNVLYDLEELSKEEKDILLQDIRYKREEIAFYDKILNELEIRKKHLEDHTHSDEEYEEKLNTLEKSILNVKLNKGSISYKEYEKDMYTLQGQKWVSYNINPDFEHDDPAAVEIDVQYNDLFIEWLKSHDLEYDPVNLDEYDIEPNSEEHHEMLVEGWAKNTIMRIAASFLQEGEDEEDDSTFQSVLASSPEGSIVENIEIDKSQVDPESEEFQSAMEFIKNRSIYK